MLHLRWSLSLLCHFGHFVLTGWFLQGSVHLNPPREMMQKDQKDQKRETHLFMHIVLPVRLSGKERAYRPAVKVTI